MTQQTQRYVADVTVQSVKANFPPGSGYLIEVAEKDGRKETHLHFMPLVKELQQSAGATVDKWPGTAWEYDFFDHRLLKPLK